MTRSVLITGAARRIGASMARALAADGWLVIAHYHRSSADAEALAAEIGAGGGRCVSVQADLADRDAVAALIPLCVARWGAPDALINNASSFAYDTIETVTQASWDAHMAPNLAAPVFLAQSFACALGEKPGCIINMLDHKLAALNPDFFSYTVAKAGLQAATRMMALAYGGRIRVCGIAPGITLISGKQTPAGFARAWSAAPLRRSSTPEELAEAARFILATGSLNGQVLVLDGGDSLLRRRRDIAFGG
jgi:NAD(P)-dependent dehydrogenase (short-subunit alcohol dehydrogenase family)